MNLRDQTHVGEHIGIAHVIKARRVPWLDDNAVRTAEIDGLAVDDGSRRMQRLGEAHAERAAIDRASGVAGVDMFRALGVQIHADFEIRNDLRAGRLGDLGGIADMIVMAVAQHDVGRPCRRLRGIAGEFRVAAEKRVDQNNRRAKLDAEGRVAEPNQVHGGPHPKRVRSGRRRSYPHTPNYTRNKYTRRYVSQGVRWRRKFWNSTVWLFASAPGSGSSAPISAPRPSALRSLTWSGGSRRRLSRSGARNLARTRRGSSRSWMNSMSRRSSSVCRLTWTDRKVPESRRAAPSCCIFGRFRRALASFGMKGFRPWPSPVRLSRRTSRAQNAPKSSIGWRPHSFSRERSTGCASLARPRKKNSIAALPGFLA